MSDKDNLKGLGGWLILVGIGVVIAPFRLAYMYGPIYYSIFTDGTFEILTTPGTEYYHSLWGPFLIGEALINSILVFASVYLVYLYFAKHYLFPKVYIAIIVFSLIFIPLDAWVGSFIITDEPMFTPEIIKEFTQTLIGAAIWVPYMLVSKRVKATFVEHKSEEEV